MIRCRFEFKPTDCWLGVFWKRRVDEWAEVDGDITVICAAPRLDMWICLLPMLPLHVVFRGPTQKTEALEYIGEKHLAELAAERGWGPPHNEKTLGSKGGQHGT